MSRSHITHFYILLILALSVQAQGSELFDGVPATSGELSYVVCTSDSAINVRDQSLAQVLFKAEFGAKAIPVQSFGTDRLETTINGQNYSFIKIQFPELNSTTNVGWVAEEFIRLTANCPTSVQTADVIGRGKFTFPTSKRPTHNYKTGMRAFKASRGGGDRLHAAADLYRNHGDPAIAATTGTVIRGKYAFYQGTYAIEVKHSDGKVIRYGEVTGASAVGVAQGKSVSTGQTIAFIGTVNSGCCNPMLHFEMYSGKASGALSQSGTKFQRRSDLMDPSGLLTQWEKSIFGVSF